MSTLFKGQISILNSFYVQKILSNKDVKASGAGYHYVTW